MDVKKYIETNWIEIISVFSIFLLALILRIIVITNYGDIVLDELYTFYFASRESIFDTVKELTLQDVHTPLYFILLHIWIKIFGSTPNAMRYCSLFFSIALIPLSYYYMKNNFNRMSGYFASIMLSINTLCAFYCIQIRFYSLLMPLTLITAFSFVSLLEKFDKKRAVIFILAHTLLIYTFTLSLVMSVFYAFTGLAYLVLKKKNIKEFALTYLISGILAIPAGIFTIYNSIVMSKNFCRHSLEFFDFSWLAIYDMLENFFSSENYQLINRGVALYRNMFDNLEDLKYVFLVFIPVLICLFGFFRSLFSKNSKLYLLALPSILTIITVFILCASSVMYYQTKYLLIVYPIIICICAYGLSKIKNMVISIFIFSVFAYLNMMYCLLIPNNLYNYHAFEITGNINYGLNSNVKVNDDDILFCPYISEKMKLLIDKGNMIPFAFDEGLLLKNKEALKYYFSEEQLKKLTGENIKSKLIDDFENNIISETFEKNLYNDYIKNMKPNQKFIILAPYTYITGDLNKPSRINKENYKKVTRFEFLMSKVSKDAMQTAKKYLIYDGYYIGNDYGIYVFKK